MILCIGVLCVAVLVPVVGRKKVSSEVRRAAVVMILVSALAILAQISEEMESGGIELELVRPSYGEGDYEEEMTVDAEGILDGYSYQVVVPKRAKIELLKLTIEISSGTFFPTSVISLTIMTA